MKLSTRDLIEIPSSELARLQVLEKENADLKKSIERLEEENSKLKLAADMNEGYMRLAKQEDKEFSKYVRKLQQQLERSKSALSFYGDEANYSSRTTRLSCGCCSDVIDPEITFDDGKRAREALKDLEVIENDSQN